MKRNKAIFLDIDGVLNSQIYFESDYYNERRKWALETFGKDSDGMASMIDDRKFPMLKKINDEVPNIRWVMSSTWKSFYFMRKGTLHEACCKWMKEEFKKCGIIFQDKIKNIYSQEYIDTDPRNHIVNGVRVWSCEDTDEFRKKEKAFNDYWSDKFHGRGYAINDWLERHKEITDFVVIDDDDGDLHNFGDRFVQTSYYKVNGLQWEDVDKVIKILK